MGSLPTRTPSWSIPISSRRERVATETPWNGSVPKVGKDSVVIGELQLFTRHDTE